MQNSHSKPDEFNIVGFCHDLFLSDLLAPVQKHTGSIITDLEVTVKQVNKRVSCRQCDRSLDEKRDGCCSSCTIQPADPDPDGAFYRAHLEAAGVPLDQADEIVTAGVVLHHSDPEPKFDAGVNNDSRG